MRRCLDTLYDSAAWLAALCMVGLLAMVAYAGYLMAGSGFLALAHTLKKGEHIRVTLLLNALKGSARRGMEIWALGAATLLSLLFAFYSVRLAWQSHVFHDISTSNDATPLWIPQLAMAAGALVLWIAMADDCIRHLRGQAAPEKAGGDEPARVE